MPQAAIQLRLSGTATLRVAGHDHALDGLAAVVAARLVIHGPQPRALLASLLWPEVDAARARANLRQRLLRMKTLAGVDWVTGEAFLHLAPGVVVEPWDGAEAGALLQGVSAHDNEALALWLQEARDKQRQLQLATLATRAAQAEGEQRWQEALASVQQQIHLDPLAEQHHRALIRLHYLVQDGARAAAAFVRLQDLLQREFGATPSAETWALMRLVEQSQTRAVVSHAPRAWATALQRPPRLVGRALELQALRQSVAEGGALLLLGEAGIGKSRLLSEGLGLQAAASHVFVKAQAGDAGVPYATLARLLRQLLQTRSAPPASPLKRLLPELSAEPLPPPAAHEGLLLQAAIEQLLAPDASVATDGVALVAVDDLHFADAASLEMVTALVGSAALLAVAWVFTQRPGEGSAAAAALRDSLLLAQRLRVVELAPLSAAELRELLLSLGLPAADGQALAQRLHRHSGGNPLFALETLKQMAWPQGPPPLAAATEAIGSGSGSGSGDGSASGRPAGAVDGGAGVGALVLADNSPGGVAWTLDRLPQPTSIGALIGARLKQLSAGAMALARVAAIAGADFTPALAEAVLARPAIELSDAWAELQDAQVLRDCSFAHDLVQDAALRSVPAAIAAHLHAAVARHLVAQGGEAAQIARHWQAAQQPVPALQAWLQAGETAAARLRSREALECFEQAAKLCDAATDPATLYHARHRAADEAAMLDLPIADLTTVFDRQLAAAFDDASRAEALVYRLRLLEQSGNLQGLLQGADEAVAMTRRAGAKEGEAMALFGRGTAHFGLGQWAQSQADMQAVAALGAEIGHSELEGAGHAAAGSCLVRRGLAEQGIASLAAARGVFERAGHKLRLTLVEQQLAIVLLGRGRAQEALDMAESALSKASKLDAAQDFTAMCHLAQAGAMRALGRYAQALAALEPLLPPLDQQQHWVASRVRLELAQCFLHLGRLDLAQRSFSQAKAAANLPANEAPRAAYIELQLRQWAAPAEGARGARAELAALPAEDLEPRRRCELLRVQAALRGEHSPAEALTLLDQALRLADQHDLRDERRSAQAALARRLAGQGQTLAAAELMRVALADRQTVPAGYPPELALAAWEVFGNGPDRALGAAALREALAWVEQAAADLPPAFSHSFLHNNTVNLQLLAARSRGEKDEAA